MGKEFILVDRVSKWYGNTQALSDASLEVYRNEWINLVGPSGAGKTTLLNLIGGLERPTQGRIIVDGHNLPGMTEAELVELRRDKIGFIFQHHYLIPYLTALENVMLAQYFHSMTDEAEAIELLSKVGLAGRLKHRPNQLSGGEQQRVGIARALINSPCLLLADEPTGNLDRKNSRMVLDLLKTLLQDSGFTIVMVTHDPTLASWADRVVTMEDGRIIESAKWPKLSTLP